MALTPLLCNTLDAEGRGYPRPLLQRDIWYSLNGTWEFAIDADGVWQHPTSSRTNDVLYWRSDRF